MGGFKKKATNNAFSGGFIDNIIAHLIKCSKQMKSDCANNHNPLKNHEDRITERLVSNYLNVAPNYLRYEAQVSENFDIETDSYIGRVDIKVISGDYYIDDKAYHIIECKRINGKNKFNKEYITEGVARFLTPMPKPKYSSYYKRNIMFGYIVKSIDIHENAKKIDELQVILLSEVDSKNFGLVKSDDSQYWVYACEYATEYIGKIELHHLFFDFADVIVGQTHD